MIIYKNTLDNLLKGAALGALLNEPICCEVQLENSLFELMDHVFADQYSWNQLIIEAKEKYNKDFRWIKGDQGDVLKQLLYFSLRYKEDKKYDICALAAKKAFLYSPSIILERGCKEGKDLHTLYRAVSHEIHRLQSFIRFTPIGDKILAADVKVENNIIDLLLITLKERYPLHQLVLVWNDTAFVMTEDGMIYQEESEVYRECINKDDFSKFWDVYYRSQYIESRKNMKLASKTLPKKYWNWMYEGKILMEESNK